MRSIYAVLSILVLAFTSCASEPKQPTVTEEHPVHHTDSMPADNTAVADSASGNPNVGMGGGR